jgi:hypothetical protein
MIPFRSGSLRERLSPGSEAESSRTDFYLCEQQKGEQEIGILGIVDLGNR